MHAKKTVTWWLLFWADVFLILESFSIIDHMSAMDDIMKQVEQETSQRLQYIWVRDRLVNIICCCWPSRRLLNSLSITISPSQSILPPISEVSHFIVFGCIQKDLTGQFSPVIFKKDLSVPLCCPLPCVIFSKQKYEMISILSFQLLEFCFPYVLNFWLDRSRAGKFQYFLAGSYVKQWLH